MYTRGKDDAGIEVLACLSKKQYFMVVNGEATLEIPEGIDMTNMRGSRYLNFACNTKEIAKVLKDALDEDQIVWTEL